MQKSLDTFLAKVINEICLQHAFSPNFTEWKTIAQYSSQNEFFSAVCYFTWKLEFASNSLSMNLGKYSEHFCLAPYWIIN